MSTFGEEENPKQFWSALDSAVGSFCLNTVVSSKSRQWDMLSEAVGEDWEWSGSQVVFGIAVTLDLLREQQLGTRDRENTTNNENAANNANFLASKRE